MTALELAAAGKQHPGSPPVTALRSVTLAIADGEFAAVVGPSGSGKSTLLALAGTLERPSSGEVRIGGTAVGQLADHELAAVRAHRIGFVFQQFFLVPTLTALDNVADYYNQVIPRRIKAVFSIAEPMLMVVLIFIVGCVALAIYLPIISLMGAIK